MTRTGLAKGANKGHITKERELPAKPSNRKGVSYDGRAMLMAINDSKEGRAVYLLRTEYSETRGTRMEY